MSSLPKAKWTRAKLPEPIPRQTVRQSYKTFISEVPVFNRERIPLLDLPEHHALSNPSYRGQRDGLEGEDYNSSDDEAHDEMKEMSIDGAGGSMQYGDDNHLFERSGLRTPPEIRRSILSTMSMNTAEEQAELERALGGASYNTVVYSPKAGDGEGGSSVRRDSILVLSHPT